MHRPIYLLPLSAALFAATVAYAAPAKKPKPKPATHNAVQGQSQMAGGNGRFGEIYTLDNGFNFEILTAHYTMDPFPAYEYQTAGPDQKVLVIDLALKNANPSDEFFDSQDLFTAVDDKGALYPGGQLELMSKGEAEGSFTLRPGQGIGQPGLNDPLRHAIVVPAKARIVKIMVGHGRKGSSEKTIRYYIAGATAAEAGEAGDPKNVITPLPDNVRDSSDPSGAVALDKGKGVLGTYVPSGVFALRLDNFAYSPDALNGNAPDDGKKYAVATVTAKSLMEKEVTFFEVTGGDNTQFEITDADGERYTPVAYLKAKSAEDAEHTFKKGDEYTFRILFSLPKDTSAKQLVLGAGNSRTWAYDTSAVK